MNGRNSKYNRLLLFFCFVFSNVFSQTETTDTALQKQYDFIRYDLNKFTGSDSSANYNYFLEIFDSLLHHKNFQINIVQFGGSHIQADVYSHFMRRKLQTIDSLLPGARGIIFPFKIVGTNNPSNYKVEYTGEWAGMRNANNTHSANWGVTGITAITTDSTASVKISFKEANASTSFNRVRIFHNIRNDAFAVSLKDSTLIKSVTRNKKDDFTLFTLYSYTDSLELIIKKNAFDTTGFELYGIQFENDLPGVVFHSLGVNGASFKSFLRCEKFEQQLQYLHPDLVIISIGTNDSFDADFDTSRFEARYDSLIVKIKNVNPACAILLTVPNDSYFKKKYHNKNTALTEKVIYKLADKYNLKVWNFYKIMGGKYSALDWQSEDLMKDDRIHFTNPGYLLKGQLLFDAFMAEYWKWLELNKPKISNK